MNQVVQDRGVLLSPPSSDKKVEGPDHLTKYLERQLAKEPAILILPR
jgi:hypothetical protein